ncbi:MAG: hypothetical protein SPJ17_04510 [Anaeroplasma sp.]|uniref:hypothetical protein n=1 Tax=Anaeroplasma sp. TaxID=1872523 RepID=UPI002A914671|nr:hypothetical protein [Anaeroplasma sp.]MDY5982936.1 hypothetical protein [Anaeroplasma sp.]
MADIITSENAKSLELQTHYYKANYMDLKEEYMHILNKAHYKIVSENDDYCEVYAEAPHMEVIAKITQLEPQIPETSIDFEVHADFVVGAAKKATTFIKEVLEGLEAKFEFKGVSLHK